MPRKGFVVRREVPADSVFGSDLVQKFINSMMWDGKRSNAQRIFYGAMEQIAQKTNDEPLKTFKKAVENVKPVLEVKTRRVFTSSTGLTFSMAFLKIFSASSLLFLATWSMAP